MGTLLLALLVAGGLFVSAALADTRYVVQPGDTLSGIAGRYGVTVDAIVAANSLPDRSAIYSGEVLTIPSAAQPTSSAPATSSTATRVAASPTTEPITYTVQPGDSLTGVARRFGVTVADLAKANGISTTSYLYVGQVLNIPGGAQQAEQTPSPGPTARATSTSAAATSTSAPTQAAPAGTPQAIGTTTPESVKPGTTPQAGTPIKYTVQYGDTMTGIAQRFNTTIDAIMGQNNMADSSIYAGQVLIIVPGNDQATMPTPGPRGTPSTPTASPTPVTPMGKYGPKWIEVDLSSQTLVAYEGSTPVYSTRISSGVARHPTVVGTFRVYIKYSYQRMVGGQGAEHYDLPNVPDVMYFYSGYAIHGAYWHNNFGVPMSHGCVNTPLGAGHWLFQWAPMGTTVVTHW